jgi:hypothetical protein
MADIPTHAFESATTTPRASNHALTCACARPNLVRFVWIKCRRADLSLSSADQMTSAGEETFGWRVSFFRPQREQSPTHSSSGGRCLPWPVIGADYAGRSMPLSLDRSRRSWIISMAILTIYPSDSYLGDSLLAHSVNHCHISLTHLHRPFRPGHKEHTM